jgi:hypothetical protein
MYLHPGFAAIEKMMEGGLSGRSKSAPSSSGRQMEARMARGIQPMIQTGLDR